MTRGEFGPKWDEWRRRVAQRIRALRLDAAVMEERVMLLHATPRAVLAEVLAQGLRARSEFSDLGLEMRRGVVYCWLQREDDRMWAKDPDRVYLEVTVGAARCRVADMDIASLALMYLQGQGGKPVHPEASRLAAELYHVTSVPLSEYRPGIFCTPEVLIQGDVEPCDIRLAGCRR